MNEPNLHWLKISALFEGSSLLALLFIGLPFKYLIGMPILVKIIGPIHGALFMIFIFALLVYFFKNLINAKLVVIGVIASFIPFGTFIYKVKLLR